jgi:hypothetical protein
MKQLIKKILKEESLKHNLKQQIKDYGWKDTAEMVNGPEELAELAFDNDPMEFLRIFDDMDFVQSKSEKDWTLYRYEKGDNLMIYNKKSGSVYIDYSNIWSFLEDGFGLNDSETQAFTTRWLEEVYKLRGVTTNMFESEYSGTVDEAYNLRGVTTNFISQRKQK